MDSIQSILDTVLFTEKFAQPNLALNHAAASLHDAFWKDTYNRNLKIQDVEIEVRLGKCPTTGRGAFQTNINEKQFNTIIASLQGYSQWDKVTFTREVVGYFQTVDESVRNIVSEDGTSVITSKQKVMQADYLGANLPVDFRLAINLELHLSDCHKYTLDHADRVVNRVRHSFSLGNVRYDLTRLVEKNGFVQYQVELELINLTTIQLKQDNAQKLTLELQQRLTDLMNSLEPIRAFNIKLLRKRNF